MGGAEGLYGENGPGLPERLFFLGGKKTKKTCVLNIQTTRGNVSDDEPAATF